MTNCIKSIIFFLAPSFLSNLEFPKCSTTLVRFLFVLVVCLMRYTFISLRIGHANTLHNRGKTWDGKSHLLCVMYMSYTLSKRRPTGDQTIQKVYQPIHHSYPSSTIIIRPRNSPD